MLRALLTSALGVLVCLILPSLAGADPRDPSGFRFSSPVYVAHESDGKAVITVTRQDVTDAAQIRYITTRGTATAGWDYRPVKNRIDFVPGQDSATFTVPLVDHHLSRLPLTVNLGLFGPSPIGLASPSNAVLRILNDDPSSILRDPHNPLGLAATPPGGDPLTGARPFIDRHWGLASLQIKAWHGRHPREAGLLRVIAHEPEVHRFGNWTKDPAGDVSGYLGRAAVEGTGTVPEFATYYLVNGHCGNYSDSPARAARYHRWIERLASGIGGYRAIMFLEMDSLITSGCLSRHGVAVRMAELRDAISILSQQPRLVVYLDAGAGDALSPSTAASLLRRAGIGQIQGFFLNSTHFDWTSREIRYGQRISRLTGGKHFVVSTSVNGRGPLVPLSRVRDGNEVLCNPPGRGLGPLPSFHTGFHNVDAFAWIGNPGKSGGACVPGAPPTGTFWPALAVSLVKHADFRVR